MVVKNETAVCLEVLVVQDDDKDDDDINHALFANDDSIGFDDFKELALRHLVHEVRIFVLKGPCFAGLLSWDLPEHGTVERRLYEVLFFHVEQLPTWTEKKTSIEAWLCKNLDRHQLLNVVRSE